jgi:two-component system response regulator AtoC
LDRTIGFTIYVRQMSFTHSLPRGSVLKVGRGSRVNIRVDDPSVSREHVALHVGDEVVEVEDLGSSNGTQIFRGSTVPGRAQETLKLTPHRRYPLFPGDILRLGSVPSLLREDKPESTLPDRTTTPPGAANTRVLFDPEMKRVYELAERAAASDISVLVMGETGVGKELLAAAVHEHSRRRQKPFLQINCAALAETLLESELFGHEKGAFTGATNMRQGLLESAQGGTVFLDELGEMPVATQAKLLRVLEERRIRRLGSTRYVDIDVRFVSATNRDLVGEVAAGRFREDLYYRISGISLNLPPLRERIGEIEPLARHFLMAFCLKSGIAVPELTPGALQRLLQYSWPGNVRELKNAMERAPFLSGGTPLQAEHLPAPDGRGTVTLADDDDPFGEEQTDVRHLPAPRMPGYRTGDATRLRDLLKYSASGLPAGPPPQSNVRNPFPSVPTVVRPSHVDAPGAPPSRPVHGNSKSYSEDEERQRVLDALEACSGNQTRAAAMLGISRRTLINRIEAFGLPRPRKDA